MLGQESMWAATGGFGRDYKKHEVRRHPNVGGMLAQRRRRWTNITPASGQRLMFAGCDWPSWISLFWDKIPSRVLRLSVLALGNDINTAIYWYGGTNTSYKTHFMLINLFTTIHDGNFRRHSSINVTIKWHKFSSNIYYIYVFFVIWSWKLR